MAKMNCWEHRNCGMESGGMNAGEDGPCPASTKTSIHGLHDGHNAGRICWSVKGTHCCNGNGESYRERLENCRQCDFLARVEAEEGERFIPPEALTAILK